MEKDKPKLWRKRDRSEVFVKEGAVKLYVDYVEKGPVWSKTSLDITRETIYVECASDPVFMDLLLEDFDSHIKHNNYYDSTTIEIIRETLMAIPPFDKTVKALKKKHIPFALRDWEHGRFTLKVICNGSGSFFVNTATMTTFQYGKEIIISTAFKLVPDVFKNFILPLLSYEEVARLEQTGSEFRELIINSNVWELLFAGAFREIYDPETFSIQMIDHAEKQMSEHSHIAYLKSISELRLGERPYYKKTDPPYWKQLYEYQMKNNFIYMRPLITAYSNPHTYCCGFYRGRVLQWVNPSTCIITYPLQTEQKSQDPAFSLRRFRHSRFIERDESRKLGEHEKQEELDNFIEYTMHSKISNVTNIIEFNNKYLFLRFRSRQQQHNFINYLPFYDDNFSAICEYDKPNTPVFKDPTKVTDCGLVGDTGYYYREVDHWYRDPDRWNIISEKERYVLVDHDQNIRMNFDHHLLFYPCYSTPSNCFLLYNTRNGTCEWHKTQRGGTFLIARDIPFNPRPNQTRMYTHSDKWLVWTLSVNRIAIKRAGEPHFEDLELLNFDPEFRINAGCIVGDRLYLFQPRKWIVVVNLKDVWTNKKSKKGTTYKVYPITHPFDYVRMTFLGPALCQFGGNESPILCCIHPDDPSVKLVACQVCQIPVQFMCSECKTPACSDEHLKCCK